MGALAHPVRQRRVQIGQAGGPIDNVAFLSEKVYLEADADGELTDACLAATP